jgi:hypothetical protein
MELRRLSVSGNSVLRRIFGPKRYEVTREWRKLHNEELNDLYSSPNTVRAIKSIRMRWAGHVERMGGEERRIRGFGGETQEQDHLEDPDVGGKMILRWIFMEWDMWA